MRSLHRSVCKSAEIPQAQPMDALGGGHYLTHPSFLRPNLHESYSHHHTTLIQGV